MAENVPSTSSSSRVSDEEPGQSLSWSFQNFPVPVQLQARIPRSPLSVAQELLPNFPSHLIGSTEESSHQPHHHQSMTSHQYQLALQQQAQQQLQQQLQRQLQLNLQGGGGESSRSSTLPDPPDTTLDIELPGGRPLSAVSTSAFSPLPTTTSTTGATANDSSGGRDWTGGSGVGGGLRSALNAAHFSALEALFRNPQGGATSLQQRTSGGSSEAGGRGSSRHSTVTSSPSQSVPLSHNNNLAHSSHHHSHHHHQFQPQHSLGGSSGSSSMFDSIAGGSISGLGAGDGGMGAGVSGVADLTQIVPPGNANTLPGGGGAAGGSNGSPGATAPGTPSPAELSLLYKWLAESGIFVILLLLHFLYDHRLGLLVFLCTGGTFYYTNMKLVHSIHQSAVREQARSWLGFLNLLWLSCFLLANVVILYYVFAEQKLWRLLFFHMAMVPDTTVWTLLWCVVMTDYIIKFLTVVSKACLAMMQPCFHNYRKRGKYYLLMEATSQLYRQLVPIVPWLYYLNDSTRTSFWFAFLTESAYLFFKGRALWASVQFLYSSFQRFQSNTPFGKKPSSSDLLEKGSQCPICQDSVNEPVMLPCKHIFCEQCVSIWFDREKTCPMCRALIMMESPVWKDGSTSAHLQWH